VRNVVQRSRADLEQGRSAPIHDGLHSARSATGGHW
jgi:hypothetical protein